MTEPLHIVVVTYNSADAIDRCLSAWRVATAHLPATITVVDNCSVDATCQIVATAHPQVRLIKAGANAGYAAALNTAMRHIPLDHTVLVSNADVAADPSAVDAMLTEASGQRVGMVVPRLVDGDGRTLPSLRRDPSVRRVWSEAVLGGRSGAGEVVPVGPLYEVPHDCEWATGAVVLITGEGRRRVRYWDESYFLYSEETDAMLRTRSAGLRIRYAPAAVIHHVGGALERSGALWRLQVRNRIALFRRRHSILASLAFQAGIVVNETARIGSAVHRSAIGVALRPSRARHSGAPGLVCFAAVDWWYHNRAHSDIALSMRIAARRPVVIVNSLGLRVPTPGRSSQSARRIGRKLRSLARTVRRVDPTRSLLAVMTTAAVPGVPQLRAASARVVAAQVNAVIRWYLLGTPDLLVTIPTAADAVPRIAHRFLCFNRSDLHSAFPEVDQQFVDELEQWLLRNSNAVLYVSHALMDRDHIGDRARFIDHGVDLELFTGSSGDRVGSTPPELNGVSRPVIGFFGGIDDYVVDLDLIARVAKETPDASVVLVGDATCSMEALTSLPNVRWIGRVEHSRIPHFGRAFDVAIMPWLSNDWIRNCNPIKIKEYLALDLPIVSTDYPELDPYRDVVRVATTPEEFVAHVHAALSEPDRRGIRSSRVQHDDWQVKADEVLDLMGSI